MKHPIPRTAVSILWGTATLLALGAVVFVLVVVLMAAAK